MLINSIKTLINKSLIYTGVRKHSFYEKMLVTSIAKVTGVASCSLGYEIVHEHLELLLRITLKDGRTTPPIIITSGNLVDASFSGKMSETIRSVC